MQERNQYNYIFEQAAAFVNHTNHSIFLTGNAGTGKTTFLKYIHKNSPKKKAIVAPTGVAAINAGGTTMHALFWLPFGTFIKDYDLPLDGPDGAIFNKQRLLSNLRFRKERRDLLRELELLIIDEVSMVRADMLDAIDTILQSVRRDARPFGGLQILFIGDMFQLPPVVKEYEWALMKKHYRSPFFFDAHCLKEMPLACLELTEIYRQNDKNFINLLNSIRNNSCTEEQLEFLNGFYNPDFTPPPSEPYITLCSHNYKADKINEERLKQLKSPAVSLEAAVSGVFAENSYPAEKKLELKVGAQVMFIKNDKGESRRYYNGKIGFVKSISDKEVIVSIPEGGPDIEVTKEKWENVQYKLEEGTNKVNEETIGTFSQFPLRLAWAVTIHKSQGLTFERAIIDAGQSFAAGQVYVALSRVRSLEGLVLTSQIGKNSIYTDESVLQFTEQIIPEKKINEVLIKAKESFLLNSVFQAFMWEELEESVRELRASMETKNLPDKQEALALVEEVAQRSQMHLQTALKFSNQLRNLTHPNQDQPKEKIYQRILEASKWFGNELSSALIVPLRLHLESWRIKPRTKKYTKELEDCLSICTRKLTQLQHAQEHIFSLDAGLSKNRNQYLIKVEASGMKMRQNEEGDSQQHAPSSKETSFKLFQEGKSIAEIAILRSLKEQTIEGHLVDYVGKGIHPEALFPIEVLNKVLSILQDNPQLKSVDIKKILGDSISYHAIQVARMYLEQQEK